MSTICSASSALSALTLVVAHMPRSVCRLHCRQCWHTQTTTTTRACWKKSSQRAAQLSCMRKLAACLSTSSAGQMPRLPTEGTLWCREPHLLLLLLEGCLASCSLQASFVGHAWHHPYGLELAEAVTPTQPCMASMPLVMYLQSSRCNSLKRHLPAWGGCLAGAENMPFGPR